MIQSILAILAIIHVFMTRFKKFVTFLEALSKLPNWKTDCGDMVGTLPTAGPLGPNTSKSGPPVKSQQFYITFKNSEISVETVESKREIKGISLNLIFSCILLFIYAFSCAYRPSKVKVFFREKKGPAQHGVFK